jgi:hypothetical protein
MLAELWRAYLWSARDPILYLQLHCGKVKAAINIDDGKKTVLAERVVRSKGCGSADPPSFLQPGRRGVESTVKHVGQ